MRAFRQLAYGASPVLVEDAVVPVPRSNEVLVRVGATGLNVADWFASIGEPYIGRLAFGIPVPKPSIQGKDLAGTIEAIGAEVTDYQVGDEVTPRTDPRRSPNTPVCPLGFSRTSRRISPSSRPLSCRWQATRRCKVCGKSRE